MAERALRGTRLGATSYENDRNTDLAPRQDVAFDCPNGHHFSVPFAAEAELPPTWECRVCGAIAVAATGESPSPKKVKPPRSHWDMLMERRTVEDLEAVLAERLEVIRERRSRRTGHQPPAPPERVAARLAFTPEAPGWPGPAGLAPLAQAAAAGDAPLSDPPERLHDDALAHLRRAVLPLDERDRHLDDPQARVGDT